MFMLHFCLKSSHLEFIQVKRDLTRGCFTFKFISYYSVLFGVHHITRTKVNVVQ